MNKKTMSLLYVEYLIKPLETIITSPEFTKKYSIKEQQEISQFLIQQYINLETLIKEQLETSKLFY